MERSGTSIAAATAVLAVVGVIALGAALRRPLPGAEPAYVLAMALGVGAWTFLVNRSLLRRARTGDTTVDDES